MDSVVSPTLNEPTIVIEKKGYEPCDMEKLVYLRNFEAVDGHTKYECKELNAQLKCFRSVVARGGGSFSFPQCKIYR